MAKFKTRKLVRQSQTRIRMVPEELGEPQRLEGMAVANYRNETTPGENEHKGDRRAGKSAAV